MKKILKPFFKSCSAILISICVLTGTVLPESVFADTVNPTDLHFVRGKMYYTDLSSSGIDVSYATDLEELLSADNTVYNKDIAVTADILASDVYDNVSVSPAGTSVDVKDNTTIYSRDFGMDNVQTFDLGTMGYTEDVNDISHFAVSHKNVTEDGTEKEIIVVAVEGTNGTYSQWCSNYDVGSDEDTYPGEHSGWLDHENHKGFDVTYRRVLGIVNTYISQNVSSTAEKTILITGHSRGGAIANLLGKYYEDDPGYKSFTYTFAAPAVTTKADTSASTIFNIINTDDAIPYFPVSTWGFKRYGTDVNYNIADLTAQWQALTGIEYKACGGSAITEKAGALSADRAGLYVLNKETAVSTDNCATEEAANAKVTEKKNFLDSYGFTEDYYTFEITENTTEVTSDTPQVADTAPETATDTPEAAPETVSDTTEATDDTTESTADTVTVADTAPEAADDTAEATADTVTVADTAPEAADDTTESTADTVTVADTAPEATDNSAETAVNTPEAADDTAGVTDDTTGVTDDTTEVTDNTTEVTDDTTEVTADTTEVTDDTAEVTDNTAEVTDDTAEVTADTTEVAADAATGSTSYTVNGYISPAFLMEFLAGLASASNSALYMWKLLTVVYYPHIESYNAAASFMVGKYLNSSLVYAHCTYAYYLIATGGETAGTTPITGTVSISGTAVSGQTLTADYNDGNAGNYITYQWIRVDSEGNETEIPDATAKNYTITDDDIGSTLKVTITGVGIYTESLTSTGTEEVKPYIPVSSVTLNPTSLTLTVGETTALNAVISPENASDKNISWSSDDPSVVSVDETGNITALSAGTATVTVTTADGTLTSDCIVTVNAPVIKYTVSFDTNGHGTAPDPQNIVNGEKVTRPADPAEEDYTFEGWYKEASCKNAWDFDNDTVTCEMTLYAKWTEVSSPDRKDEEDKNDKENKGSTKNTDNTKSSATPKTGDETPVWIWLFLAVISAGTIAVLAAFLKRKNN